MSVMNITFSKRIGYVTQEAEQNSALLRKLPSQAHYFVISNILKHLKQYNLKKAADQQC